MLFKRISWVVLALLAFGAEAGGKRADATGTWTWRVQQKQKPDHVYQARFKVEGTTLTGTVTVDDTESAISEGKVENGELSFALARPSKSTLRYKGKLGADTIKGTFTYDVSGVPTSKPWVATRVRPTD